MTNFLNLWMASLHHNHSWYINLFYSGKNKFYAFQKWSEACVPTYLISIILMESITYPSLYSS